MSSNLASPRGTNVSVSSLIVQNRRLREENETLSEELAQCQVDKEFVWSLWKKLQVESPNVTDAVAMVIERERQKAEVKDRKVLEILRLKDARIEEVQKEMAQQSKELGLAVQKKLELQSTAEQLQAEKASADARLAAMAAQLDELRAAAAQRSHSEEEADRQRRARADLGERLSQLECERSDLRADRDRLLSLVTEKDRLLAEHHAEASKWSSAQKLLQDKHKAVTAELEACQNRLSKTERSLRNRIKELEGGRAELARVQAAHAHCEAAASEQEAIVRQMQALQQETEKVLRSSESAHLQETASLQALYSNLNRQYADLKNVEGQLRRTVEDLHTRVQRSESEAALLRQQLRSAVNQEERREKRRAVATQISFPVDEGVQTRYEPDLEVRLQIEGLEDQVRMLRDRVNDKNRQIDRLSQEKSELQEECAQGGFTTRRQQSRAAAGGRRVRSASEGAGGRLSYGPGVVVDGVDTGKRLALADRKLDDAERLLEKRNEQLESLRQAHRRRLQRLKSLLTSYRLMKEQLQIAEEELRRPPKKKIKVKRPPASDLRKEINTDAAWNELNYFKAENKNLMVAKMNLEEEVDDLRVRVADEVAANHELTVQLDKERDELRQLLRREAAHQGSVPTRDMRLELQSLLAKLQESDARIEDLKVCLRESCAKNEALEESNRRLKVEASGLRRDITRRKMVISSLNNKIEKLRHAVRRKLCCMPRRRHCRNTTEDASGDDEKPRQQWRGRHSNSNLSDGEADECCDDDDKRAEPCEDVIGDRASADHCLEYTSDRSGSAASMPPPHFSTPVAKKYERTLKRSLRQLGAAFKGQGGGHDGGSSDDNGGGSGADSVGSLPAFGRDDFRWAKPAHADLGTERDSTTQAAGTADSSSLPLASSRSSDVESLGQAIARRAATAPAAAVASSQTSPHLVTGGALAVDGASCDAARTALTKDCRSAGTSPIKVSVAVPRRSIRIRPARSALYHVSSMKQRLLSLQRQVHVLTDAKANCLADAAAVRQQCESLQQELNAANQRCMLLRQANQKLQSDLDSLQVSHQQLQERAPDTDAVEKMTAELRTVEGRLRASASEVTRQGAALKALKCENDQLCEEVKDAQEKAGRLERDNAQKKVLLDDLRLKLSLAKDSIKSEMSALEQKADEHGKLKQSLDKLKTANQSMKAQLTAITKERHDYENLFVAARGEAERAARQLAASQARCAELQAALGELEAAAKQQLVALAEQGEAAVEATQRQLLGAHRRSEQFAAFLTALSTELLRRGERLWTKRRERARLDSKRKLQERRGEESDALRKAKTEAQRILEISAADLDELMDSCDSAGESPRGGSEDEDGAKRKQINDMKWVKRWQALIGSQGDFSKELTGAFLKKIDELAELD